MFLPPVHTVANNIKCTIKAYGFPGEQELKLWTNLIPKDLNSIVTDFFVPQNPPKNIDYFIHLNRNYIGLDPFTPLQDQSIKHYNNSNQPIVIVAYLHM